MTRRDPDYLRAKRIMQGLSCVDPAYDAFTERFRLEYGISPLAVFVDTMGRRHGQGNMPQLGRTPDPHSIKAHIRLSSALLRPRSRSREPVLIRCVLRG